VARIERVVEATPEQVYAVLADGWNYADWVVGAVHIREVDRTWPAPGSKVQPRVGAWPFTVADSTTVVACDRNGSMRLRARLWPLGEAEVNLNWRGDGPNQTRISMAEEFAAGPLLALKRRSTTSNAISMVPTFRSRCPPAAPRSSSRTRRAHTC
jgi:Polyketide cyclase / dehydrase and lipid transport